MMIITGPNMAGKSTYMRQVALICLMAQVGSFVPAREAHLPVCDRIFTRVGASDDLASGQSTFMVEMSETAYILRNATASSLIILDEIGRGTSTFDGLAIAWAVVEYIANKENIGAKTLFATHYHELSELEGHLEGVKNYCISVKEHGEDVIFLRKIVRGGADKSFGVHVARLAGIPHPVIVRAHEIQARLEVSDINQNTIGQNILGEDEAPRKNEQVDLFDYQKTEIIQELQQIDVMALTPMDAINKLFLLREKARKL
jgi:DNA mismatch repair protein MutS